MRKFSSVLNALPVSMNAGCCWAIVLTLVSVWLPPVSCRAAIQPEPEVQLYFFTNDGCAPCRQVEPAIEALARDGFPVMTIKVSEQPQWARHFRVTATPTVVLVVGEKVEGYQPGLITESELRKWFAAVDTRRGGRSGTAAQRTNNGMANQSQELESSVNSSPRAGGTKVSMTSPLERSVGAAVDFKSPTMHRGVPQPSSRAEALALQATVRLRVEDAEGISFATGTVIHSSGGESLVMTCGHVFRDAMGKGRITAEYGFADDNLQIASGELIHYDADARDIAVVAIRNKTPIEPVRLATRSSQVLPGLDAFSIGCDHGESPTIRHTRIKNRAKYDGSIKYDIFGRPVVGRSGGGLFTESGELIGVCNAAAVEVDEGIYTALDTIYWQLDTTNLAGLFEKQDASAIAANAPKRADQITADQTRADNRWNRSVADNRAAASQPATWARDTAPSQTRSGSFSGVAQLGELAPIGRTPAASRNASSNGRLTQVGWSQPAPERSDREVIIMVRSKSDPNQTETIIVSDPTPRLLDYLDTMSQDATETRSVGIARMRQPRMR